MNIILTITRGMLIWAGFGQGTARAIQPKIRIPEEAFLALSEGRGCLMSLYIKTEDYRKHGISKYSDLAIIRAVVQEELKMDRVFVSFVNRHEYIRVDFLQPRPPRRTRRRHQHKKELAESQQA
jgi:hypothetical protein